MTGRSSGIVGGAAVLMVGVAVFVTAAASPTRQSVNREPNVVPRSSVLLSCPESPQERSTRTSLFAVAPPGGPGATTGRGGSLTASPLDSSPRDPVASISKVGVPASTRLTKTASPSVTVVGQGRVAVGAFAAQESVSDDRQVSGLEVSACQQPADSWWFNAVDTSVGSTARLVLSNPTPAVAVVDLKFYGPDGVVDAVGARGIPVAPRSRQSLNLAKFAPSLAALTLHVSAERGRVAAAVGVSRITGTTPSGDDWISPGLAPSTHLVVNPGESGPGEQSLVVTNPGRRDALVQVRVLDESGPFTPTSLKDLRIKPGRSKGVDITDITTNASAALSVTSSVEVTAATVSERPRSPLDFTVTTSSPSLTDPAVVPIFTGTTPTLGFTTVHEGGARLVLKAYDGRGAPLGAETVNVRASSTALSERLLPGEAAYIVVTVRDGTGVHGVVTYHNGAGLASMPIVSGEWTISRPAVRPAL
jgi:hypothetical protein